jgi:Ca2+-binding EF-hand superfamily protein
MTERIIKAFKFPRKRDIAFPEYCELINDFLNKDIMEQKHFAFHILDTNNDGFICPNDLFQLVKWLRPNDYAIANDIMTITKALDDKRPDHENDFHFTN